MSGPYMPYLLEKGPYLEVFENLLADPTRRRNTLLALRNPNMHLWNLMGLQRASLDRFGLNAEERRAGFRRDWLGVEAVNGAWTRTQGHFWEGWQGDPEAILRAGFIRAIEVSLGIDHDVAPPAASGATVVAVSGAAPQQTRQRFWPIDFYWMCQGPLFQCWVLSRQNRATNTGHVSVVISTPAAKGHPLVIPITRPLNPPPSTPPPHPGPGYEADPPLPVSVRGLSDERTIWVVGHADYSQPDPIESTAGSREGNASDFDDASEDEVAAQPPASVKRYVATSDDVVCVRPSETEGGIFAPPLPY